MANENDLLENLTIAKASADDASEIASIIYEVSGGVVDALLTNLIPGHNAKAILEMVLRDQSSIYSLKNITLLMYKQNIIGLLFAYDSKEHKLPSVMNNFIARHRTKNVIEVLTKSAPNSLYINTFWIHEDYRKAGFSDLLLDCATQLAQNLGLNKISLHCFNDSNAKNFYQKHGFIKYDDVKYGGEVQKLHPQGGSILVKELS